MNKVEILNDDEDQFDDDQDIKIVDMQMTIGAPIDRKEGERVKLENMRLPKFSNFFNMYTVYMQNNSKDDFLPMKCGIIV